MAVQLLQLASIIQKGIGLYSTASKITGGKGMGSEGGFDLFEAIASLLPGTQGFLGEVPGETFSLGGALANLIPGYQTALGEGVPGMTAGMIAKQWNTGTARFYLLKDGRIAVRKKSGVWRVYRPQKHIVVPRNPRIGTLLAADRRVDRLMRGISRRIPRRQRRLTTPYRIIEGRKVS